MTCYWSDDDQKKFERMQEIALTSGRAYRGRRRLYVRRFPLHKVVFWSLLTLAVCYVWWVAAMIFINWNWPAI